VCRSSTPFIQAAVVLQVIMQSGKTHGNLRDEWFKKKYGGKGTGDYRSALWFYRERFESPPPDFQVGQFGLVVH
jgi:hypothetical protein